MSTREPEALDGRQIRTQRSRRAICDAYLDLVQEGVLQPSADQIADRAGLSRRSIFYHFSDLGALSDAVVEAGMQRSAPLLEEIPSTAPLGERVARQAAMRARFLDATTPFRRAIAAQALAGPMSEHAVRVARDLLRKERDQVAALFADELASLPAPDRSELVEALAAAVSPPVWDYLRTSRGLSSARARAILQRSLAALLRDAGFAVV